MADITLSTQPDAARLGRFRRQQGLVTFTWTWPCPENEAAEQIGARVRVIRLRRGQSQRVLAGLCGISAPYLSMIENGKRRIDRFSLLTDLAAALQVTVTEFAPGLPGGDEIRDFAGDSSQLPASWCTDPLTDLAELEDTELQSGSGRRQMLAGAACWAVATALPDVAWWQFQAEAKVGGFPAKRHRIGPDDVAAVRQLSLAFSQLDQLRGGGHGTKTVARYLHSDAATMLQSGFVTDQVRRNMFSAIGELAYLSGWMAFDNNEHGLARRYFLVALKLAARASDPPLAGHILRAMAHQAIDLGMPQHGIDLAEASVEGQRYLSATPRERSLLGVVHARALAAVGSREAAARALLRAEDDLRSASAGIPEPSRTFFFGEASLAHEAGRTLQSCGDLRGAVRQFKHSSMTRGAAFRRTHAVTLGYLGAAQMNSGDVDEACATWGEALDLIDDGGISSGRAQQAVADMRQMLTPLRGTRIPVVTEIDERISGIF